MDLQSYRDYGVAPQELEWWRLSTIIEELMIEDLLLPPEVARESVSSQRARILHALESPSDGSGGGREAFLKRIAAMKKRLVEEPDPEKRYAIRDEFEQLMDQYDDLYKNDQGRSEPSAE